jgi:hypothetical protein
LVAFDVDDPEDFAAPDHERRSFGSRNHQGWPLGHAVVLRGFGACRRVLGILGLSDDVAASSS